MQNITEAAEEEEKTDLLSFSAAQHRIFRRNCTVRKKRKLNKYPRWKQKTKKKRKREGRKRKKVEVYMYIIPKLILIFRGFNFSSPLALTHNRFGLRLSYHDQQELFGQEVYDNHNIRSVVTKRQRSFVLRK